MVIQLVEQVLYKRCNILTKKTTNGVLPVHVTLEIPRWSRSFALYFKGVEDRSCCPGLVWPQLAFGLNLRKFALLPQQSSRLLDSEPLLKGWLVVGGGVLPTPFSQGVSLSNRSGAFWIRSASEAPVSWDSLGKSISAEPVSCLGLQGPLFC